MIDKRDQYREPDHNGWKTQRGPTAQSLHRADIVAQIRTTGEMTA